MYVINLLNEPKKNKDTIETVFKHEKNFLKTKF